MNRFRSNPRVRHVAFAWALAACTCMGAARDVVAGYPLPTRSGPIALTTDNRYVWVVNRDNNSVSVLYVYQDKYQKVAEIPVGIEPRSIAITPDNKKVYETNAVSGSVWVIDATRYQVLKGIKVGTEPMGCALTPDGSKLYVANFSSNDVSVINTATDQVTAIIPLPDTNKKPCAIAVSTANEVYVTSFLAHLPDDDRAVDEKEGRDDGREGRVTVISSITDTVLRTVVLEPQANTGFKSNGSVLDRIPATNPATFTFTTGAFPNLLQGIAIKGAHAYVPSVGSSPNGPVRFNVNVQSLLSAIDTTTDVDAGLTLNMNRGVQFENVGQKLFNTTPITIAFKQGANEGFAVLGGTDRLLRVVLAADGTPSINAPTAQLPPGALSEIIRIPVGKNPQGIVINSTDTRAYVLNYISRDVSVVDISGNDPAHYKETARIQAASLPAPGTQAAIILLGHELFNTSIGPAGTGDSAPPAGRMSDTGWGNCYNCHPDGLHDGVTWMFADGPRQTISLHSTGEHPQPSGAHLNANGAPLLPSFKQRVLNWSATRDEVQDFELNIRAVSGGQGLIRDGNPVVNLVPTANTSRDPQLDAIAAYVTQGVRAPISPLRGSSDPDIAAGRQLFASAKCTNCHGGPNWTRNLVDFTPPPTYETITNGQLVRFLSGVGTFDPTAFNEVKEVVAANGTASIVTANGSLGLNTPSLLSVFAGAPYFHSGDATSLDALLENITHRSAGTGGKDPLPNPADRAKLVKFLESIDAQTPTFP